MKWGGCYKRTEPCEQTKSAMNLGSPLVTSEVSMAEGLLNADC